MGILRTDKISGLEKPTAVTGSVEFDGNDHLEIGSAGDFNFLHNARSDWTAECWVKSGDDGRQFVFGTGASSAQVGFSLTVMSTDDNQDDGTGVFAMFGRGSSGNYRYWGSNSGLALNTWHHIAAVFKSSDKTLVLYVDGREVDSGTGTAAGTFGTGDYSTSDSSYAFLVAKNEHADTYLTGYVSNLRVVDGRRLYTSNFTPPVHELEPINGTRILCCNNSDSVTAVSNAGVESAPIATASGDPSVGTASTEFPGLTRDFTPGTEFRGVTTFDTQGYFVPPSGTTTERFPNFGAVDATSARGVFAGGYSPGETNIIDYVTISTLGDAQDFGDLTVATEYPGGTSDRTRGLTLGGQTGSDALNTVSFVTIASTGNASDFGDLTNALRQKGALANSTRAIAVGGSPTSGPFAANNVMDYFTIQSSGNGLNFGDLTELTNYGNPTASSVRGVFSGMSDPNGSTTNTISYVTISTTGNAQNFGDLDFTGSGGGGLSNSTRGVIARDNNTELDFITIASLGNSQDFGTLTGKARYNTDAAVSSSTRGLFMIGAPAGDGINYITILSTGNGQDFGDLTRSPGGDAGFSNGHGGLG